MHDPKLTVVRGVEHTVFLFFNNFFKILIVNQTIIDHKAIHNLFGSGIYHKTHSIFKLKVYEFQNMNIGLFSGNDTRVSGYFIGFIDTCALESTTCHIFFRIVQKYGPKLKTFRSSIVYSG